MSPEVRAAILTMSRDERLALQGASGRWSETTRSPLPDGHAAELREARERRRERA